MLRLYWQLGRLILDSQRRDGYGGRVVEQLSADLRREFPGMRGLGRSTMNYMRSFAAAWPDDEIFQQAAGKLPWGHHMLLLDRLDNPSDREWYAAKAVEFGWSRAVLLHQIMSQLHLRSGSATTNFASTLPAAESELMQQLTKDPYSLEFLGLTDDVAERTLENALVAHVERFLLELGQGFAFVGRQYPLTVGRSDFFIDLLFFHIPSKRYLVLELKRTEFTPEAIGKLNFYVNVIDDRLRTEGEAPTIGMLLCAGRDERVVRYTLSGVTTPLAVAGYTLSDLPDEARRAIPAETGLIDVVDSALDAFDFETDE